MKCGRVTIPLGFITTTVGQQDVLPGCTDPLVTTPAHSEAYMMYPIGIVGIGVRPCCRIRLDVLPNSYRRDVKHVRMTQSFDCCQTVEAYGFICLQSLILHTTLPEPPHHSPIHVK